MKGGRYARVYGTSCTYKDDDGGGDGGEGCVVVLVGLAIYSGVCTIFPFLLIGIVIFGVVYGGLCLWEYLDKQEKK